MNRAPLGEASPAIGLFRREGSDQWKAASEPTISVVVCAYSEDRFVQILAAIDSLRRQTVRPEQCILVIDHNEPLLARARMQLADDIDIVPSTGPRGLSGARNTGVDVATGEIVAFLDDDATAEPTFLERLIEHYTDPDIAGAGGAALPVWPGERPAWFPEEFDWIVGCSYRGLPERAAPVRNLIGAGMSFRRSALAAAGPFDTGIGRRGSAPLGCEETLLSIRLRQALANAELMHVPSAVVHHTVSPDRARPGYFVRRCFAEGRSKALVADRVGSADALASERAHAFRTLPAGVGRGCTAALRGDAAGLARAGMILVGLAVTAAGFAAERARRLLGSAFDAGRRGARS